jgi:endonuclease/exonuclease/phosphatase family metal-dependent hydrolase
MGVSKRHENLQYNLYNANCIHPKYTPSTTAWTGIICHPIYVLSQKQAYQLDYCFNSSDLKDKMISAEIGHFNIWIKHSDHLPVIITLKRL